MFVLQVTENQMQRLHLGADFVFSVRRVEALALTVGSATQREFWP